MTLAFFQSPIRFASGLPACLLLATLVGPANAETPTRLDAIVGAGALRVGLTEDYRPFSFADASGKVEGIDVDMAMSSDKFATVRLQFCTGPARTTLGSLLWHPGRPFDTLRGRRERAIGKPSPQQKVDVSSGEKITRLRLFESNAAGRAAERTGRPTAALKCARALA
jgi:hypothetical protein